MLSRLALGVAAVLSLAAPVTAQTMARTYGSAGVNDTPSAGAVAPDGSLVMLGFFNNAHSIAYFDPAGNIEWARSYGPFLTDVAVAPDGSIVACGSESGLAFAMKVSASDGSVQWQRTYPIGSSLNRSIAVANNGEILTVGKHGPTLGLDVYLCSLSSGGGLFQDLTVGTSFENDEAFAVTPLASGGYAVAATTNFSGAPDRNLWVLKVDDRGLPFWARQLGTSGNDGSIFRPAVAELANGDIVVTAGRDEQFNVNDDVWVVALEPTVGNVRWERSIAVPSQRDAGVALAGTSDGGVAVVANTHDGAQTDVLVVKLDAGGTPVASRLFGGPGHDIPEDIVEAPGGDLVVFGSTDSFGADTDAWILRLDPDLVISPCCVVGKDFFINVGTVDSDLGLTGTGLKFPGSTVTNTAVSSSSYSWTAQGAQCATNDVAWADLGNGLAGTLGVPCFAGIGTLESSAYTANILDGALPGQTAARVVGFSLWNVPLVGGTLVPAYHQVLITATDTQGRVVREGPFPPGVPSGFTFTMQYLVQDPGAPQGWAFSNAIQGVTP